MSDKGKGKVKMTGSEYRAMMNLRKICNVEESAFVGRIDPAIPSVNEEEEMEEDTDEEFEEASDEELGVGFQAKRTKTGQFAGYSESSSSGATTSRSTSKGKVDRSWIITGECPGGPFLPDVIPSFGEHIARNFGTMFRLGVEAL